MSNPPAPPKSDGGGVTAVTRALQLLEAFALGESRLSLAELSRRAGLHKTTVLRLARTLAQSGYMVQREDGDWRLGPAAGWLGARYQAGFDVQNVLEPALRELTQASGESARATCAPASCAWKARRRCATTRAWARGCRWTKARRAA
jgi:hypothetical protein